MPHFCDPYKGFIKTLVAHNDVGPVPQEPGRNALIPEPLKDVDQVLLIKGSIPGAKGDYVLIRESKKYPKGSKHVRGLAQTPKKGKAAAAAQAAAKK